ncbi:MAG TPA: response regulator [Anaerolineaceae bacterium]
MTEKKSSILIVEDDVDVAEMLNAYFRVQGYEVTVANFGEDGVAACLEKHPDLVILDIRLPDIDGFEVAVRLRQNRRSKDIPFIFLTEKRRREDRLRGLELQADDYITKPFDIQELRLRVRNTLQRASQGSLTNPVTNLPEGALVDEALQEALTKPETALALIVIRNLEAFRNLYGFVALDDLLRSVSLMLRDILDEAHADAAFLGQITQGGFLLITSPSILENIQDRIIKRLESSFEFFYSDQDRTNGIAPGNRLVAQITKILPADLPRKDASRLRADLELICR